MARSHMRPISPFDPGACLCFGSFKLFPAERLLTRQGVPVELGGRALDVLLALVAQAGSVVEKDALIAAAWPGMVVTEGSLRLQITLIRKALGDGVDGARYISNVMGRGYSFVAELSTQGELLAPDEHIGAQRLDVSLPGQVTELYGRGQDVAAISQRLAASRFLTIVGAGGVGKTSVAIKVGHDSRERLGDAIAFVDFAALSDPALVPTAVAAALRLSVRSADPLPSLLAWLRDKRLLLILDNCEHVIDAAAGLASGIAQATTDVHILATSREPLHVPGEQVFRLEPLATPPDQPGVTADAILAYPATRLFVERAGASGATLDVSDADAPVVADICRKLDGLALAIELAARRVATYGLQQTAALLNERLTLAWRGQRGALPRHQTLRATLDWSYDLLDDREKRVLCQLPVFVGDFTLAAARQVVPAGALSEEDVVDTLACLAEKSLLAVHLTGSLIQYRLLESTRDYLLSKSDQQIDGLARRHARYVLRHLEDLCAAPAASSASAPADIANVRAALEWSFGPDGEIDLAVAVAAAATPMLLATSLLIECRQWAERALRVLNPVVHGLRAEMQLFAALGLSLMFTRGNTDDVRVALAKSLELAQALGDAPSQVQLLGALQIFDERVGNFKASLSEAERSMSVATASADPATIATANAIMGLCQHLIGDQIAARTLLEAALAAPMQPRRTSSIYIGFDHRNRAGIALARTLWLRGHANLAMQTAQRTVEDAGKLDHPVTLCIALIWAVSVYVWAGDFARAEADIDRFIACAQAHSLGPYLAVGRGVKGELAIRTGVDIEQGIAAIRSCLVELHESRYELLNTGFNLALAEGLGAAGRTGEALALLEHTIAEVNANGDLYYLPELLRIKARTLQQTEGDHVLAAQACLAEALALSQRQGALSWTLRAATDLARLWAPARRQQARDLLASTLGHFEEGFETADLLAASLLLQQLDSPRD
ncbi:ATP-binding protein [Silvimonas iriomotensis]|uniref:Transcriptional regulator n=1 Tax=Silvimonas iriomotensis TaxID=449662 RepID=A0ABQ2P9B2_9NEIS|nr:winged helix-turn-helix domain-containing protein [Silvimonas iriomotensis]GGP21557.1 transcriptional regulator [Silvimonas iriomotensis]